MMLIPVKKISVSCKVCLPVCAHKPYMTLLLSTHVKNSLIVLLMLVFPDWRLRNSKKHQCPKKFIFQQSSAKSTTFCTVKVKTLQKIMWNIVRNNWLEVQLISLIKLKFFNQKESVSTDYRVTMYRVDQIGCL